MKCKGKSVVVRVVIVWFVWAIAISGLVMSLGSCDDKESPAPKPPVAPVELGKAQFWLTTGDRTQLLSRQSDISVTELNNTSLPVITLDPAVTYQQIEGFGAALTGSSAYLINKKLTTSQRQSLIQDLFDNVSGIGISALRLTIGASDFSLSNYTYDDMPVGQTDPSLSNFSIAAERVDLIPVLKSIHSIATDLTLIASPWTAPAWMKTNGSLMGGSLRTEAYDSYANYLLKYVIAMDEESITIDAITMQNEPLHTAGYPSMSMTSEEQKNFLKNNLGPLFTANSLVTKIILYDHNWDNTAYAISILDDPAAKQYAAGSAFHAYAGSVSAMSTVHSAHPDKGLYFTEISGGEWATDFASNLQWNMSNIFIGTMKNWSKTALLWNLALDQNNGPKNNGCDNCRGVVTINSTSGVVTRNVEYYSIGHFSKFIRNGAFRIGSSVTGSLSNVDFVPFRNADGSRVMVLSNSGATAQSVVVVDGEKQLTVSLPASSVSTFKW